MRSRSESDPTRIPTTGLSAADMSLRSSKRDVAAVLQPRERDPIRGVVRRRARGGKVVPDRGHVQDPAAVRDELLAVAGCPRVEDERPGALRLLDAADRRAAVVAPLRVGTRGEHDRYRRAFA